ncbi:MAG: hypothetical protein HQM01_10070 [Magnetococcales bacterium]|nr:hypothetical protein [Magnetococcales bacterium]
MEDTRKAVHEARARGVGGFGVTIDREAQAYFPRMFGPGGFAVVRHLRPLSLALPCIDRQLIQA